MTVFDSWIASGAMAPLNLAFLTKVRVSFCPFFNVAACRCSPPLMLAPSQGGIRLMLCSRRWATSQPRHAICDHTDRERALCSVAGPPAATGANRLRRDKRAHMIALGGWTCNCTARYLCR